MTAEIAIVGAGLSGLACAHRLAAGGCRVTLFEKSRGPGGRCATRRSEAGPFHHGAPAFSAQGAAFRAEVARWQAAGWVRPAAEPDSWVGWPTMNTLARQLAAGLHVVTEATVSSLNRELDATDLTREAWRLQFAEAALDPAGGYDAVVVAAPAEQAGVLTQVSAPLQALLRAVHSAPCWTLMLAWPAGAAPGAMPTGPLPQDSPLARVVDCSALPPPPGTEAASSPGAAVRWTLHATPDWSRAHLEFKPDEVIAALLQALAEALPSNLALPPPSHAAAHRWRYAQVVTPAASPFGWDAAQRLGSCGDAWQGAAPAPGEPRADGVERAWLSGVGLADTLLQALVSTAAPAA